MKRTGDRLQGNNKVHFNLKDQPIKINTPVMRKNNEGSTTLNKSPSKKPQLHTIKILLNIFN